MKFFKKDLIAGFTIFVMSLYLLLIADRFKSSFQGRVEANFWPKVVLGLLVVLSIINIFSILKNKVDDKEEMAQQKGIKKDHFKLYSSIILMVLYVALINIIGFVCLTPIFLIILFWILGYRKKLLNPLIAIVIVIAIIYIFPNVLYLMLPRGVGIFRDISLIFY